MGKMSSLHQKMFCQKEELNQASEVLINDLAGVCYPPKTFSMSLLKLVFADEKVLCDIEVPFNQEKYKSHIAEIFASQAGVEPSLVKVQLQSSLEALIRAEKCGFDLSQVLWDLFSQSHKPINDIERATIVFHKGTESPLFGAAVQYMLGSASPLTKEQKNELEKSLIASYHYLGMPPKFDADGFVMYDEGYIAANLQPRQTVVLE